MHEFVSFRNRKQAVGAIYLFPHETYHEQNRKFYEREVFRYANNCVVDVKHFVKPCAVMHMTEYRQGRPKGGQSVVSWYI